MKTHKRLLSLISIIVLSGIIILVSSCNKDKDDDNTMKDIKSYQGKTDQDQNVKFQTGVIKDQLYLKSYDMTVIYIDVGQSFTYEAADDNSDGIIPINNNTFEVNLGGTESFIKGNLISNQDSINGQYGYKFEEGKVSSGDYRSGK